MKHTETESQEWKHRRRNILSLPAFLSYSPTDHSFIEHTNKKIELLFLGIV